jgi:hypothetical protein
LKKQQKHPTGTTNFHPNQMKLFYPVRKKMSRFAQPLPKVKRMHHAMAPADRAQQNRAV